MPSGLWSPLRQGVGEALSGDEALQAILEVVPSEQSGKILRATTRVGKSFKEISSENDTPLSSTYTRVHELTEEGLLVVGRVTVTGTRKRYVVYRSAFREIRSSWNPANYPSK